MKSNNDSNIVYLAGSVQFVEDGKTWREEIIKKYPNIIFISPYEGPYSWETEKSKAFIWCKHQVLRSDFVLIRYERGEETWGTPSETVWAWEQGIPILAWQTKTPCEIPNFLDVMADEIDPRLDYLMRTWVM